MLEKLIRDHIPQLAADERRELATRIARADELDRFFGLKLVEETQEVIEALTGDARSKLIDELADLRTVIDDLAALKGVSPEEIDRRAAEKRAARGGFAAGIVLQDAVVARPRLHVGGSATFVDALRKELLACVEARIAVAFVMRSGLDLLEGPIRAALLRGARVKLLTTDYLGVTEPEALDRLLGWAGHFDVRVYSHERRSFHPKAYLFERADGSGRGFIGSANISRMGLRDGVEWTWTVLDFDPGYPLSEIRTRFEELFESEDARVLSSRWIAEYRARRQPVAAAVAEALAFGPAERQALVPRPVQALALAELERLRSDGQSRALVVAATGLGKTFLAAFDSAEADRVLFIAHREELLRQAADAFEQAYPDRSRGFVMEGRAEFDRTCVFASVQTLSRPEHLRRPELARFDYVVIDEFHHAAAESYRRVLDALRPRFLLGLTATPFRGDNRDLLELCDGNLAYQVGLFEAIAFGWLVPFRYYGVADVVKYTDDLLTSRKTYDASKLTVRFNTAERASLVVEKYRQHDRRAALGFCVSIDHADFMAAHFSLAGVPSAAVHSGPSSEDRVTAVRRLSSGELRILFTVDMFNEGVDIPTVDLVMFLRPTESMVVFLQQLGRGLRLHREKGYLTVLDFIGNYRNAHFKLPFLAGQDLSQGVNPAIALRVIKRWVNKGVRPNGIPEGVEIHIEPVALETLRKTVEGASPLRQLVLDDLRELAEHFGRPPTLTEWQLLGRYSLATARTSLGVDRWHQVLRAADHLTADAQWLEGQVGDFLREVETTSMNKSFKMVVVLAMCSADRVADSVGIDELVRYFREYFSEERHRGDVVGTDVEDVEAASAAVWQNYLEKNPINAWVGGNIGRPSPFFKWNAETRQFRYIGPRPARGDARHELFAAAVKDRATAKLNAYWGRPGPGKFVFSVIPTGASGAEGAADKSERNLCVMFGKGEQRSGLPEGWHAVRINGQYFYGKFMKIALNILKSEPSDDRAVPNGLTQQLRKLFLGADLRGPLPPRARVRFFRSPTSAAWEIVAV